MKIRNHFRFTGQVQGVGFRYRARSMSQALGLTGWVKNEWDGSVTMELQGEEVLIDRVLHGLSFDSYIRIDDIEKCSLSIDEEERSFSVRY